MTLIGRDREIALVADRLRARRPVAVVGDAGVGKTAVLEAAVAASGLAPQVTGCLCTLSWSSFLPVSRLLGGVGEGATVESVGRDLLRVVGDGALVVDDLQWADHETRELLSVLAPRVALAFAVRSGDAGSEKALAELAAIDAEFVMLEPLARSDARLLVERARPDLVSAGAADVTERGGGNPLLLLALCHGDRSADSLRLAYAARFADLSGPATRSLARLALVGRPVEEALIGPGASELIDAGLGDRRGSVIAIRHPVIAEVAALELGAVEARRVHAELATLVGEPAEAAHHLAAAGDREAAYTAALDAAESATPPERARLLALAADNAPAAVADEQRVLAAEALLATGQRLEAERVADEVGSEEVVCKARAGLVRCRARWAVGDDAGLSAEIDAGLRLTAGSGTSEEVAVRVWDARRAIRFGGDPSVAQTLARDALALSDTLGAHAAEANAAVGSSLLQVGSPECRPFFEEAVRVGVGAGDFETAFDAGTSLLGTYQVMGDWPGYGQVADQLIGIAEDAHLEHWVLLGAAVRALPAIHADADYTGTVDNLQQLLREPLVSRGRITAGAHLALALGLLGRHAEAVEVLEREVPTFDRDVFEGLWRYWAGAETRWLASDAPGALAAAEAGLAASLPGAPIRPLVGLMRSWALVDLGRDPAPAPDPSFFPLLAPIAVEFSGLEALAEGRHEEAAGAFDEAADQWRGRMRHGELRARWAAGEAWRRAGNDASAEERLFAVEDEAAELGAAPFLARARRSLRQLGHRRSAPRSEAAPPLTGRERQVLALVADGLTSEEIGRRLGLGRRTIDGAIESAMVRLGATTRLQAALMASDHVD